MMDGADEDSLEPELDIEKDDVMALLMENEKEDSYTFQPQKIILRSCLNKFRDEFVHLIFPKSKKVQPPQPTRTSERASAASCGERASWSSV